MRKNTLRILVGLLLVCSILCLCGMASAEDSQGSNLTWNLDSNGVLTISGTGSMEDGFGWYSCPWESSDIPITAVRIENGVTSVSYCAFYGQKSLTSVSLPQSIVRVGSWAFADCDQLKTITLPGNISEVENYAFGYDTITLYSTIGSVTAKSLGQADYSFKLPDQPFIMQYLYDGNSCCTGLSLVKVTKKLKTLTVPEGVTKLDGDALEKCASKLEYIELPQSVSSLSTYVFSNTPRKFYIKCRKGSYAEQFAREQGLQYDNGKKQVIGYNISNAKGKAKWVVSNYLTKGMSERQKVRVLHNWLVNNAHYDLTYSTHSADGVLIRGSGVCESYARAAEMLLTEAGLANRMLIGSANNGTGFGGHAWNLVRIDGQWYHLDATWDDPVSSLGKVSKDTSPVISGFEHYDYFLISDSKIKKNHRWSAGISADKNQVGSFHHNSQEYVYTSEGAYKLNKTKKTAQFVFLAKGKAKATKLSIPATVTFGGTAYKVTEIAKDACQKMTKLKQLSLGENITKIGSGAFRNCGKLQTVTLGKKIKTIEANAFYGCTKLKTVKYANTKEKRDKIKIRTGNNPLLDGKWKYAKQEKAAKNMTAAEDSTVTAEAGTPAPETKKPTGGKSSEAKKNTVRAEIGGLKYKLNREKKTAAFTGCADKNAASVTIPSTVEYKGKTYEVTKIGADACRDMPNLAKVTIGKNVVKIEAGAFRKCVKLKTLNIKTAKLTADSVDKTAFRDTDKKISVKCPAKKLEEYRKILVRKGIAKTAAFE